MNKSRIHELEFGDKELTSDEKKQGWHWCPEWDFMLIGPGCPEVEVCPCGIEVLLEEKQNLGRESMNRHERKE